MDKKKEELSSVHFSVHLLDWNTDVGFTDYEAAWNWGYKVVGVVHG